jgi:hypothetical protein
MPRGAARLGNGWSKRWPAQSHPSSGPAKVTLQPGKLDTGKIAKIVGHEGEQSGAVYKITIGRDDLKLKEMGATINARMGLNTWAAFVGNDENAAVAGDVAMLEGEVNPVLKTLRRNGLDVVAIHHHMIGSRPVVIFLHYWGKGPTDKLAAGFKAALDQLGKKGDAAFVGSLNALPREVPHSTDGLCATTTLEDRKGPLR